MKKIKVFRVGTHDIHTGFGMQYTYHNEKGELICKSIDGYDSPDGFFNFEKAIKFFEENHPEFEFVNLAEITERKYHSVIRFYKDIKTKEDFELVFPGKKYCGQEFGRGTIITDHNYLIEKNVKIGRNVDLTNQRYDLKVDIGDNVIIGDNVVFEGDTTLSDVEIPANSIIPYGVKITSQIHEGAYFYIGSGYAFNSEDGSISNIEKTPIFEKLKEYFLKGDDLLSSKLYSLMYGSELRDELIYNKISIKDVRVIDSYSENLGFKRTGRTFGVYRHKRVFVLSKKFKRISIVTDHLEESAYIEGDKLITISAN